MFQWTDITLPADFVMPINHGGKQGQKPMSQRMEEVKTSNDPITTMVGDHMRFTIGIKGRQLTIPEDVKFHVLQELSAVILRPPSAPCLCMLYRMSITDMDSESIETVILSTNDMEEAQRRAEEVLCTYIRVIMEDMKHLLDLNDQN